MTPPYWIGCRSTWIGRLHLIALITNLEIKQRPKACRLLSQRHRRADTSLLRIEGGNPNHSAELTRSPAMPHGLMQQWLRKEPEPTRPNEAIQRRQTESMRCPVSTRKL